MVEAFGIVDAGHEESEGAAGERASVNESVARSGRKAWAPEASIETAAMLRLLMVRPWLYAGRDDAAIAAVRRNLGAIRDAFGRLGWVVHVESGFVRLRKSPPQRLEAHVASGQSPLTCQWFFLLVAGAESMGRRVALGQLVTAARAAAGEAGIESTGDIRERRAVVGALRMLSDRGIIEELDGSLDGYVRDENAPVLLEVHHTRLQHVIANFAPVDPSVDPEGWLEGVTRETDAARRMRRRLVDDTVVHVRDLDDAEADWMSRRVRGDDGGPLAKAFGLHLERRSEGAAFVVPDDAFRYPAELGPGPFPGTGTVAHASWLVCAYALKSGVAGMGEWAGWRSVVDTDVATELTRLAAVQGAGKGGWRSELARDPAARLFEEVLALLQGHDLVRLTGGRWYFSPAVARWRAGGAGAAAFAEARGNGEGVLR